MHLSSNLERLILYTVQSSTSRVEILQLQSQTKVVGKAVQLNSSPF